MWPRVEDGHARIGFHESGLSSILRLHNHTLAAGGLQLQALMTSIALARCRVPWLGRARLASTHGSSLAAHVEQRFHRGNERSLRIGDRHGERGFILLPVFGGRPDFRKFFGRDLKPRTARHCGRALQIRLRPIGPTPCSPGPGCAAASTHKTDLVMANRLPPNMVPTAFLFHHPDLDRTIRPHDPFDGHDGRTHRLDLPAAANCARYPETPSSPFRTPNDSILRCIAFDRHQDPVAGAPDCGRDRGACMIVHRQSRSGFPA